MHTAFPRTAQYQALRKTGDVWSAWALDLEKIPAPHRHPIFPFTRDKE